MNDLIKYNTECGRILHLLNTEGTGQELSIEEQHKNHKMQVLINRENDRMKGNENE